MTKNHVHIDLDAVRRRLDGAIKERGVSRREISLKAGVGHNYVHGIIADGKEPTILRLAAVCDALGVSLLYILYGSDVSAEAAEIIRRLDENPAKRAALLDLLTK